MTTLKSIALELLQKYEESETSVIWEYSGDIEKSEENLAVEVAKYRELIDKYAEQAEDAYDKVLAYLKENVDDFPDYHEAIEAVLKMKGGE